MDSVAWLQLWLTGAGIELVAPLNYQHEKGCPPSQKKIEKLPNFNKGKTKALFGTDSLPLPPLLRHRKGYSTTNNENNRSF